MRFFLEGSGQRVVFEQLVHYVPGSFKNNSSKFKNLDCHSTWNHEVNLKMLNRRSSSHLLPPPSRLSFKQGL